MSQGQSRILDAFSHPAVGITGTVASVVGLVLAIYFYLAGERRPLLTAFVYPVRTTVVKLGEASALGVTVKGAPVTSDVTAVQVAIWNAGNDPIRHADILEPVRIRIDAPILHASVRYRSRNVTVFAINESRKSDGLVRLGWSVLEQDDGGVVQIIYAGPPDVKVSVSSAVVGQRRIRTIATEAEPRSSFNETRSLVWFLQGIGWFVMVVIPLVFVTGMFAMSRRYELLNVWRLPATWAFLLFFAGGSIVIGAWLVSLGNRMPPFVVP